MKNFFELIGRYFMLMSKTFSRPEKFSIYRKRVMVEMASLGLNSIGIVAIISVFMGAVIAIQMALNLESPFIPQYLIGYATRESMLLEFSSTVVALILAGKVGSNIASEIGTMRITEQIDALEIMGVNSSLPDTAQNHCHRTLFSLLDNYEYGDRNCRRLFDFGTDRSGQPGGLPHRYPLRLQTILHHLFTGQIIGICLHHHLHIGLFRLLCQR